MKKLMTLLIFSMLLVACVKPEPPAPPPPVTYTISVSITGKGEVVPDKVASVPLGETRTLVATAETDWAVYSAKSNSVIYEVPFLSASYSFSITNVNANQNAEVVFVKKVDLWTSKDRWYLWIEEVQYEENGPWLVQELSPQHYTDFMIFTLDGKFSKYRSDGTLFGGPYYPWIIAGETLSTPGTIYTIRLLDGVKMVLEYTVSNTNGGHRQAKSTYQHTPKPLS